MPVLEALNFSTGAGTVDTAKKKWPSVYSNMRPCVAVLEIAAQMADL